MVILHVKHGDENLFLYETNINQQTAAVIKEITAIYNGRLKIERICSEIEYLATNGPMLPYEMIGLTEEQIEELKLVDIWADKCVPSGGWIPNKDVLGRRNGRQPNDNMQNVLKDAIVNARAVINKKLIQSKKLMNLKTIEETINLLRGAVTIVYPMQLPPHDVIRMEFSNTEDLDGTQASKEVIDPTKAQLWFAGRQILPDRTLKDYIGGNDKSKVIVKLNQLGQGAPGREAVIDDVLRRQMMNEAYKRQETLRKLEQDDDDQYLNSSWSDSGSLKRQMHGLDTVRFQY